MNDLISNNKELSILLGQNLGVLASYGEKYPYTCLVGFAVTEDLKSLLFATMSYTRKYKNIKNDPRVSILINSGINSAEDFKDAVSVTALGKAVIPEGEGKKDLENIYLLKFPFLKDFIKDPSCELVKIEVDTFIIVTRFQEVKEIVIKK